MIDRVLKYFVFAALTLSVFGCVSTGFNRGALREQIGVVKPTYDDTQIKEAFTKKANLPKPFKLGVYFRQPQVVRGESKWRWSDQDKATLDEIGIELKSEGVVSEVFPIFDSVATSDDLKSLRLAAAKHQADALLIVSGATQIDRYTNNWGWSYLLLVPALFVPGSSADTLFVANASMWDVKNEFLYLTAETEATSSITYVPAFAKNDKDLIDQAKTLSMAKLKIELKKMIKGAKP